MPRPASVRLATLAGFLVLAPRPAAAMPQPAPPRGPVPPCASGPGGLIGCIPSPGDVLSGAARTAGGGVMKVFTVFFTDGANWFLERLEELVTAPTRPDLSVGWWVEKYNLMLALAAVVAAATLILALIDDAAKASPEGLARAILADVPVAGLVGGIGPLVIQYLVDLADWLNGRLLQDLGADSAKTLSSSAEWFAAFSSTTGNPATPAVAALIAALITILAAFVIFLELMLRANAIYLIAALIPVLYAVRIWPAARTVVRRTTEVLVAVVFVQPVVGLAVAMGAAASATLRVMRHGDYPPPRGACVTVGDRRYLYATGYLPSLGRYPHGHVPAPLQITDHVGDTPSSKLLDEVLLLTKMNWNSARFAEHTPVTVRFAGQVGEILRDLPDDYTPEHRYAFYM